MMQATYLSLCSCVFFHSCSMDTIVVLTFLLHSGGLASYMVCDVKICEEKQLHVISFLETSPVSFGIAQGRKRAFLYIYCR